ncbi:MAG: DeoR/GlpR transcriptional regulator [Christensenellaceae bacterium]|nr:DeoR/GlpR transcriptional regulator [Christensenellaceae bacterium]
MLQIERQQKILEILDEKDLVTIPQLEDLLEASKATIYRDIKALQKEGKLEFVRGGISKAPFDRRVELPYQVKRSSNVEEKRRIAREAADSIHPGSTVWLDSSTTVFEMVKYLDPEKNLKVITNDLMVAAELTATPGIECHVVGGTLRKGYFTLVGLFAMNNLKDVQIDTAFFGTNALGLKGGAMIISTDEVALKQQVLRASAENILLVDHTKFGTSAFLSFCDTDQFDQIITGSELPDNVYDEYLAADINLLRV